MCLPNEAGGKDLKYAYMDATDAACNLPRELRIQCVYSCSFA